MASFSTRLKVLSATGVVVAGLGVAALSGAFTGALHGTALAATTPPTATATVTTGAKPGGPTAAGPGRGFGVFPGMINSVATFLGMSPTDLQTALRNGQTLAQVAQAHGKSTSDLKTFLTNQLKTQLDQQLANGKITSQQETNILDAANAHLDQLINTNFQQGFGKHEGRGPYFGLRPEMLQIVAQTLGMNVSDVRTALQNGQTLAQIAQAHGKTSADLENALLAAEKTRLDKLMNTNFQQLHQQRGAGKTGTPAPAAATPTATSG